MFWTQTCAVPLSIPWHQLQLTNVFVQATVSIPLAIRSSLPRTNVISSGYCQHDDLDTSNQLTITWIHVRCSVDPMAPCNIRDLITLCGLFWRTDCSFVCPWLQHELIASLFGPTKAHCALMAEQARPVELRAVCVGSHAALGLHVANGDPPRPLLSGVFSQIRAKSGRFGCTVMC
jgi:hypothetical protein